jgi:hypothetical protein
MPYILGQICYICTISCTDSESNIYHYSMIYLVLLELYITPFGTMFYIFALVTMIALIDPYIVVPD